jgi:hypothetical protein
MKRPPTLDMRSPDGELGLVYGSGSRDLMVWNGNTMVFLPLDRSDLFQLGLALVKLGLKLEWDRPYPERGQFWALSNEETPRA